MSRKDAEIVRRYEALMNQEAMNVAALEVSVRKDCRKQQADTFLTGTAKEGSYELRRQTLRMVVENPRLAAIILEAMSAYDDDHDRRQRFRLNMRALGE